MALSRDKILNANDLKPIEVHVPEWVDESGDDIVLVRALSGEERDEYEGGLTRRYTHPSGPLKGTTEILPESRNANARLVVKGVIDEHGSRIFRDEEAPSLGQKNSGALTRLFRAIAEASGMTAESADEAAKNSETVPSDGSTSSEPEPPESQ